MLHKPISRFLKMHMRRCSKPQTSAFASSLSADDYTSMVTELSNHQSYVTSQITRPNLKFRIVCTSGDGRVFFDSRGIASNKNTYENYIAGTISDNHNTRSTFMKTLIHLQPQYDIKSALNADKSATVQEHRLCHLIIPDSINGVVAFSIEESPLLL